MKTIERIKKFIDFKGLSLNKFDDIIQSSNGYIGKQIKKKASIGSDMLENIFCIFEELNPTWLLTGKGAMLNKTSKPNTNNTSIEWFQNKFDEKDIKIEELNIEIKELNKEIKDLLKANDTIQQKKTA